MGLFSVNALGSLAIGLLAKVLVIEHPSNFLSNHKYEMS